jgi:hypothetical protein
MDGDFAGELLRVLDWARGEECGADAGSVLRVGQGIAAAPHWATTNAMLEEEAVGAASAVVGWLASECGDLEAPHVAALEASFAGTG